MKFEPLTVEAILPWWLRDGVRPVPPNPLHIPGLDGEKPAAEVAASGGAVPEPVPEPVTELPAKDVAEEKAFDRAAFAAALVGAGHHSDYAATTAARAARVFGIVPLDEALGRTLDKSHAKLAALTPASRKKALQAAGMAVSWLKDGCVRAPKTAMGGRKARAA